LNQQMGLAGRQTVETRFTQELAGEAFLDTYRQLLKDQPGKAN